MLQLVLSAHDGGTAWRHALSPGEARAGWEHVGPLGLAKRLGRLYGLRGEPAPHADRVSAFAARLAHLDDRARSFSRSRAKDPWGVASFLLGLRDLLRASGWEGSTLDGSPRLRDLAAAEEMTAPGLSPVPPGLADVFAQLLRAIESGPSPEPLTIRISAPGASLDPMIRRVVVALALKGAVVQELESEEPAAPATSDLGRLQRALLASSGGEPGPALSGDGSVIVLEADSPLEVAELVSSYARTRPLDRATLVAGRDLGALDAAFARQGLPALDSSERSRWRPALQALPLRLSLAFAPRDPFRAAELLMLPVTPIPWDLRRRLLDALVEQPGIGSPAWRDAFDEAVAHEVERARRENPDDPDGAARDAGAGLRERVAVWFGGEAHDPREGIPAPEAVRICEAVAKWADARGRAAEDPLLLGAARIARSLARLLAEQPAGTRLTPVQLEQLHDIAVGDGLEAGGSAGEAGRPAAALHPDAVQPGADEVVWWGFLDGDAGQAPEPWTASEREALIARGVQVADPGARRGVEARGWRQPVLAASRRLVLVRWRLEGTEPTVPHPLADEIAARFAGALAPCTVTSEAVLAGTAPSLRAAVSDRAPAPEIVPRAILRIPPDLVSSERLSPSSLEKLFGCPVAWVLEYAAGLRRRGMARIPSGSRLLGTFAHAILEDLLHGPDKVELVSGTPEDAASWAGRAFDARVATEAAPLVARGAEVERHRAREVVCEAARALFALLQAGGWRVRAVEEPLAGRFEGADLAGSADLVLEKGGAPAIVDLKLAKPKYFREKLENGQGLQVALYADMARTNGTVPPTGYFLIGQGELYTVDRGAFPGARELDGPSMQETLAAAREALRFWRKALSAGVVASRHKELREGAELEAGEATGATAPSTGPGGIDPPCRFCEYDAICGVELREVAR
jgi:ATP-dependent helicase/nuclease subunit B